MRVLLVAAALATAHVGTADACKISLVLPPPPPAVLSVTFVIDEDIAAISGEERFDYPALAMAYDDSLGFESYLPERADASVITYGPASHVRVDRESYIDATLMLGPRSYMGDIGRELIGAFDYAVDELRPLPRAGKYLVVISDGNDEGKESLAALRADALEAGIVPLVVVYRPEPTTAIPTVAAIDPRAVTVASIDDIWPAVFARLQAAPAEATSAQIMEALDVAGATPGTTCGTGRATRVLFAVGSVLALLVLVGTWFIRRETPGQPS